MDALRKVVKKGRPSSPSSSPTASAVSKHTKLADQWGVHNEPVKEGVTFYVKYLGSTLVTELDDGESYGDHVSSVAVKTVVAMAKAMGKKLVSMSLTVSSSGLKVISVDTKQVFTDLDIYRINFCTADKVHDKVFAYIARSTENETMECHCFLCPKKKVAHAITLTVAQAFNIAKEEWEEKETKELENKEKKSTERTSQESPSIHPASCRETQPTQFTTELIPCLDADTQSTQSPKPQVSSKTSATTKEQLGFEDNFTDMDAFASLAESRSKSAGNPPNPFGGSIFQTGLRHEDIDNDVLQISQGKQTQDLHRPPSVDDLLCL